MTATLLREQPSLAVWIGVLTNEVLSRTMSVQHPTRQPVNAPPVCFPAISSVDDKAIVVTSTTVDRYRWS